MKATGGKLRACSGSGGGNDDDEDDDDGVFGGLARLSTAERRVCSAFPEGGTGEGPDVQHSNVAAAPALASAIAAPWGTMPLIMRLLQCGERASAAARPLTHCLCDTM